MFEEAPAKKKNTGAPAWVMTFADLMSLLLCFFVLLLSFSELDVSKYKELAGSLKFAFGVQRDIPVKEPPKGINVIAREFSPARPEPTPMNVIRQITTNDFNINLDLGKMRRPPAPSPKAEHEPEQEKRLDRSNQADGLSESQQKELQQAKQLAEARLEEKLAVERELVKALSQQTQGVRIDEKSLQQLMKAKAAAERKKKLEQSARLISNALDKEIKEGSVDVEAQGQKVIIRVREKASFGSGRAELKDAFRPLLARVASILKDSQGKIIVAGHTDNVPINTERFRSNWELSAARAVSVAHEMMLATEIPNHRFLVQGFADTQPMTDNSTPAHRATNRRVEIILLQGEDVESADRRISAEQGLETASQPPATESASLSEAAAENTAGTAPDAPAPEPAGDEVPQAAVPSIGVRVGGAVQAEESAAQVPEAAPQPSPAVGVKVGGSR